MKILQRISINPFRMSRIDFGARYSYSVTTNDNFHTRSGITHRIVPSSECLCWKSSFDSSDCQGFKGFIN